MLIDHGRATAEGTPLELKAQIGDLRVDVTTVDQDGFTRLQELLAARYDVTANPQRRMLSVPAPRESEDLAAVASMVRDSRIPVDEVALRRPTLDDAFLAFTGQPPDTQTEHEDEDNAA